MGGIHRVCLRSGEETLELGVKEDLSQEQLRRQQVFVEHGAELGTCCLLGACRRWHKAMIRGLAAAVSLPGGAGMGRTAVPHHRQPQARGPPSRCHYKP